MKRFINHIRTLGQRFVAERDDDYYNLEQWSVELNSLPQDLDITSQPIWSNCVESYYDLVRF